MYASSAGKAGNRMGCAIFLEFGQILLHLVIILGNDCQQLETVWRFNDYPIGIDDLVIATVLVFIIHAAALRYTLGATRL